MGDFRRAGYRVPTMTTPWMATAQTAGNQNNPSSGTMLFEGIQCVARASWYKPARSGTTIGNALINTNRGAQDSCQNTEVRGDFHQKCSNESKISRRLVSQ